MKTFTIRALAAAATLFCIGAAQATDIFEPTNSTLQLDYVSLVGGPAYSTVVATVTGYEVLGVDGGTAKPNTFDASSGILSLGSIAVNKQVYTNARVRLINYQLKNVPTKMLSSDTVVAMQLTAPATTGFNPGSLEDVALKGINTIRLAGGFGAANSQKQLTSAATAHQRYLQAGDVLASGTGEIAGNANYLADTPSARCAYYGFTGACREVATATTTNTTIQTYDMAAPWTTVISDLQTVLDYRNVMVGSFGQQGMTHYAITPTSHIYVYKGVYTTARANVQLTGSQASGIVGVYPTPDMTSVGIGGSGSAGAIALAQFPDETNPTITTFVLRKDGASTDHPVTLIAGGSSTADGASTQPGWAILQATTPLEANSKYTATLIGDWKGTAFARAWSFTTGSSTVTPVRR